jgi:hypothetical protein
MTPDFGFSILDFGFSIERYTADLHSVLAMLRQPHDSPERGSMRQERKLIRPRCSWFPAIQT